MFIRLTNKFLQFLERLFEKYVLNGFKTKRYSSGA
jgi:hypothetical protein